MKPINSTAGREFGRRAGLALLLLAVGRLTALGQSIPNPSFEADTFTVYPGYISLNTPITGWTADPQDKAGLNPASGSPFADNGTIPNGNNVAFIQWSDFGTTLSTTVSGLTAGTTYKVTFRENARNGQTPNLRVSIDGVELLAMTTYSAGGANTYWHVAFEFTASATSHTLAVLNDAASDNTVLVDDFKIAPSTDSWSVAAWVGDADSGVEASYFYTHAYNFGSATGAEINGVTFTGAPGANPSVAGQFSTTWLGNVSNGDANSVTAAGESSAALATDFVYGGTISAGNFQSVTISGLTAGTECVATLYTMGWENPDLANRWATFSVGDDHLTINQDQNFNDGGLVISHRYTADASGSVTLKFIPINPNNMSIHIYGFSNREAVSRFVAPVITSQPQNVTVALSQPATFSVTANGIPAPTYQWRFKGGNLAAATEASHTIPAVSGAHAGDYAVVLANSMGSVTSVVARLTVGLPMTNPSFEEDLFTMSPGYVSGNSPITGWEALGGHGLNPANGSPFADNGTIPHGNQVAFMQADGALSQTVAGLTPGAEYYVHYYENARTVVTVPSLEVQVGGNAIVPARAVTPVGSGSYHEIFSEVFAATAADLALSFIKSNPQGGDSTALIDNVAIVPVAAGTAPTVTSQPQPQLVSVAQSATFSVRGLGSLPLSYQWLRNGVEVSGATAATLTLSNLQKPDEADFSVRVSNAFGTATSAAAHLTVYEPIPDLFNTGVDTNRVTLADGAIDPHWSLVTNPDTGSADAIVEGSLPGAWLANTAASKWIGPQLNTAASALGLYTYRTVIDLTDRDPKTLVIEGRWATDNTGRNILVNGVSSGNAQNTAQFGSWTTFTLRGTEQNFVAGTNTIDFVVDNETAVGYTGLRVEVIRSNLGIPAGTPPEILVHPIGAEVAVGDSVTFTASGRGTAPLSLHWNKNSVPIPGQTDLTLTLSNVTAAASGTYTFSISNPFGTAVSNPAELRVNRRVIPGIFGTGVGADGALLPAGAVDPHFVLSASADGGYPGPDAIVMNEGWPIDGTWLLNGPNSKWIAPQASQSVGNVPGDYTYQTTFDLTGYDLSQVTLNGGWAVDNTGVDILVNGVSTGITCPGFGSLTSFTITNGLVAGMNTLDFLMNNAGDAENPTGLRVDLRGLVKLATQPALQATLSGGNLSISWSPASTGQKLQSALSVTGPWSDVDSAANPYVTSATEPVRFFRVVTP